MNKPYNNNIIFFLCACKFLVLIIKVLALVSKEVFCSFQQTSLNLSNTHKTTDFMVHFKTWAPGRIKKQLAYGLDPKEVVLC